MTSPVDLAEVITWPQAAVAIVIVVAVLVVPQIIQIVQNKSIKHEFTNNSGSTLKDAVDRIESTLTEHVEASAQRAAEVDERLSEIESANGRHKN